MKLALSRSLASVVDAANACTWAAPDEQHGASPPGGTASALASKATPGKARPEIARMDIRMKAMQDMREKMVLAKTPEERDAVSSEHMKAMGDGIAMMNETSPSGEDAMKGDMPARHRMMEERMEMTQATMQTMTDRLPIAPAK